jgi:hypothetical protein
LQDSVIIEYVAASYLRLTCCFIAFSLPQAIFGNDTTNNSVVLDACVHSLMDWFYWLVHPVCRTLAHASASSENKASRTIPGFVLYLLIDMVGIMLYRLSRKCWCRDSCSPWCACTRSCAPMGIWMPCPAWRQRVTPPQVHIVHSFSSTPP